MKTNKDNNSALLDGIKRIAYDGINNDVEVKLAKWWTGKYKLPPNDERFLSYTIEELLVEYYEDVFLDDPKQMSQMTTEEELQELEKEDEQIEDVNPIFVEKGKKVDLEKFKVKNNEDKNA